MLGGLSLNARLFPYRLLLSRKKPVELEIEISNKGDKPRLLSLEVLTPRGISLDRAGLKKGDARQLGEFPPGVKRFKFDLFPSQSIENGEHLIEVTLVDHHQSYQFVTKKLVKKVSLLIED
ncbi:MAG TPA: hypothetical protein VJK05_01440 [archaeon]|nr:hypothetical protein [archaeon]